MTVHFHADPDDGIIGLGDKRTTTFTSKDARQITWGGCSHTVIPIEIVEDGYGWVYHFFPEIGVAFHVDLFTEDEADILPHPTSIRALPGEP